MSASSLFFSFIQITLPVLGTLTFHRDDIDKLDFQTAIEEKKNSDVLNYFIDSQIEFTDTDEKEFDELYKKCTDIAWIDNRNKA